jgi:hypothetical protein
MPAKINTGVVVAGTPTAGVEVVLVSAKVAVPSRLGPGLTPCKTGE